MKGKILIVDDLAFVRLMLSEIVKKYGFEYIEASNGIEAVKKYKQYKPDIVLLDITMPYMNGIDALKNIMQFDSKANVIMCSALGQQKIIINSIKIGAKDFVVKPFKEQRIMSAIFKIMNHKEK